MSEKEIHDQVGDAGKVKPDSATMQVVVVELAKLDALEYDQCREAQADLMGVRVSTLDQEVNRARKATTGGGDKQGREINLEEPEPWAEPVEGAELLDSLMAAFLRYLVLPEYGAEVLALWTVHAHVFEAFYHSPRLSITAPEKQCGKTVALDVLETLTPRSIRSENVTTAVLFRIIDGHRPTVLLDEADSFLKDNEELRGALNAGHRKGGKHLRCEGDGNELKAFKTFAPTGIASIGALSGTLADRSIPLVMRRARADERIEVFRSDRAHHERILARKAARWAADNFKALSEADPVFPPALFNRSADNWRPLLAIADLCSEGWSERARAIAVLITTNEMDADSVGEMLLADLRDLFQERRVDKLSSTEIVEALTKLEGRPWVEWRRGNPITANGVARLLKPFKISSSTIRLEAGTAKGYRLDQFKDAFVRYLRDTPLQSVTPSQVNASAGYGEFQSVTRPPDVTVANHPEATDTKGCDDVTVEKGGAGDEGNDEWSR